MKLIYVLTAGCLMASLVLTAGNPDRQGEAGANQLLINPWARTAGLHTMNTASVTGAEAVYQNVAGLSRINKTQVQFSHTRYLVGADLNLNAIGLAQKVGKNGALGISMVAFDLGDFYLTTEDTPEGSNSTFSPSFFNLGVSYSHLFENKVSVGFTTKLVSESIANVSASALSIDAGVQYVTGENDAFKFGISLRNIGNRMRFTGDGLNRQLPAPNPTFAYQLTFYDRSAAYELPTQLNIGASYDFLIGTGAHRITPMLNFTSNAFSRDQAGVGLEYAMNNMLFFRAAYKHEFDTTRESLDATLDNGLAAGFTVALPVRRDSDTRIALDYAYRSTIRYNGIHNIGLRIDL